jgi:hypothetical protein
MTIDVLLLALGLLLLWFPRAWMRMGATVWQRRSRRRSPDRPTENSLDPTLLSFGREFTKLRNYYDFLRAAVGGLAIVGGAGMRPGIGLSEGDHHVSPTILIGVQAVLLLLGVAIQTVRYERGRLSLSAPVFYLGGLSVCLCSPWGALFAFGLMWGLSPMVPNAQGFLSIYACILTAFGRFFLPATPLYLVAGALCFLPVLLSLLVGRPLFVFSRRSVSGGDTGHA